MTRDPKKTPLKKAGLGLAASSFALALSMASSLAFPTPAAAAQLSLATFVPERSPTVAEVFTPWVAWFNKETAGETTIKIFAGGTLGRNPKAQPKLVRDGVADITVMVPSYYAGVYTDLDIFELPGLARSVKEGSESAWALYKAGKIKGFEEFKVVAMYTSGPYAIHSKELLGNVAALKGKKVRVTGEVQTAIASTLGMTPQDISALEMAEAIDRGLIDGAVADWSVARTFKLMEVTKHHFDTRLGVLPFVVVMNKKVYDKLPPKSKAAVDASGERLVALQSEVYGKISDDLEKAAKTGGSTVTPLSAADEAAIDAATAPVREKLVAKSGQALLDAYRAQLKSMRK